ncbi:MAG TPA: carbohydrate kinase [Bryobacteraceae bacterium]|nr:carbohydrate kinase [Bryobacteraceae bacterium]
MRPVLVSAGEILWDQYPDYRLLGGAPFNLAAHAARLGFDSYFLSAVGEDALGQEALNRAAGLGVEMQYTRRHPVLPTGIVDVTLDAEGHPSYHLRRPSAWEEPQISSCQAAALLALRPAWLVCGTLQQTCPLARDVRLALPGIPVFYDVNLRPGFEDVETIDELLGTASVVKCNEGELAWLARELELGEDPARTLLSRYPARILCVTLGAEGCEIHTAGETVRASAPQVDAIDTVGAGDAFSAALLHGLTQGWPLDRTARFANELGAVVASRRGAIPDWTPAEVGGPCRI